MQSDIGDFIKGLRENARISLRQLADQAGVSNPYLSQIERGLRKPSAEVLAQIASALRVSTPLMYLKAGLLGSDEHEGVRAAITADPQLTVAQKQSLTQIYDTFLSENARRVDLRPAAAEGADPADTDTDIDTAADQAAQKIMAKKTVAKKIAKKTVARQAAPRGEAGRPATAATRNVTPHQEEQ